MTKYSREQDLDFLKPLVADDVALQLQPLQRSLLNFLPDESLYSYMARHHRMWGDRQAVETIKAFFGTATGRSLHDDLRPIDVLVARTQGRIGDARRIYHHHTHLKFYKLIFSDSELRSMESGRGTPNSALKFPMGLWTGHFHEYHPLKACVRCMQCDVEQYGMTYWRLEQQFPGMWVCLEHGNVLQETTRKRKPHERFLWQVPSQYSLEPPATCFADARVIAKANTMSRLVREATAAESGREFVDQYRQRLRQLLEANDLLTGAGKLKISQTKALAQVYREFNSYVEDLRLLPQRFSLPHGVYEVPVLVSRFIAGLLICSEI